MINKNNFSKKTKGQSLPLNTIVIAILVVIVMVVVIVMFSTRTTDAGDSLDSMGNSYTGCNDKNTLYTEYDNVKPETKATCLGKDPKGSILMADTKDENTICCGSMNPKPTPKP